MNINTFVAGSSGIITYRPDFVPEGCFPQKNVDDADKQERDQKAEMDAAVEKSWQVSSSVKAGGLQKIILARELSQNPKCVIASSPTRGLDVGAMKFVHNRLVELRQEGVGVLLISEDLDEIFNVSDRIAVMFRGKIMGVFPIDEIDVEKVGLLMAGVQEVA